MKTFANILFILGMALMVSAAFSSCKTAEPINPSVESKTYFVSLKWDNEDGTTGGISAKAVHKKE